MTGPVGIGIIGAGVISDTYLTNLGSFPDVRVVIVGDLHVERAEAKARAHGVAEWGTADDVIAHPLVQLVVNLTIPAAHVETSSKAIAAGKHVWTEKPIGLDRADVLELLHAADVAGVRIGSAPDTVLGAGFQTAKRAVEAGLIGRPLFAQTAFQTQGPDLWHPAPQFLFTAGAGPLLDMGPYYFTGLVSLFGAVERVGAVASRFRQEREIRTGPNAGASFPVEVPTTFQIVTLFESGQQAQTQLSFDSALERHGVFEIHGTEGSLRVPDPNRFGGPISYVRPLEMLRDGMRIEQEWIEVEQRGATAGRGLGVLEMVRAISEGRPHVATGELGYHVLDVMLSAGRSAEAGEFVTVDSGVAPVPSLPVDFDPFARTL